MVSGQDGSTEAGSRATRGLPPHVEFAATLAALALGAGLVLLASSLTWQTITTPLLSIPSDRRLGISFTLAGIGSFANPLGSFGGSSAR